MGYTHTPEIEGGERDRAVECGKGTEGRRGRERDKEGEIDRLC